MKSERQPCPYCGKEDLFTHRGPMRSFIDVVCRFCGRLVRVFTDRDEEGVVVGLDLRMTVWPPDRAMGRTMA